MQNQPNAVMLFAAGFGSRMGDLTADTPKPLLKVQGKTLLARALDIIADAGISNVVINTHYLADKISHAVKDRDVTISPEKEQILETGGGVRNALPLLGVGPIYTMNPDVVWKGRNPLTVLAQGWRPDMMDGLLLLIPKEKTRSYGGKGDFSLDGNSLILRGVEYVYSGAQIINPDKLHDIPETSFSLNLLWNMLIASKSLYGVVYSDEWCDVGSPKGILLAENMLIEGRRV